jgi:hypothetical protein
MSLAERYDFPGSQIVEVIQQFLLLDLLELRNESRRSRSGSDLIEHRFDFTYRE